MRRRVIGTTVLAILALLTGLTAGIRKPAYASKQDAVIDMTGGYWEQKEGDIWDQNGFTAGDGLVDFLCKQTGAKDYKSAGGCLLDLDGDGSWDLFLNRDEQVKTYYGAVAVPTAGCSINGDFKVAVKGTATIGSVIFRFGKNPGKKTYGISISKGSVVDPGGHPVTSAAPGDKLYLVASAMKGTYVEYWKSDDGRVYERFQGGDPDKVFFIMPRANVNLAAKIEEQTPLRIDMSEGYCETDSEEINPNGVIFGYSSGYQTLEYNYSVERIRVDYDIPEDVLIGYKLNKKYPDGLIRASAFFIPLGGTKIRGVYKYETINSGMYWPYTFVFAEHEILRTYKISVKDGYALDADQNKEITEAAPGTRIRIIYTGEKNQLFAGIRDTDGVWSSTEGDLNAVMPARDITFVPVEKPLENYRIDFRLTDGRWEWEIPDTESKSADRAAQLKPLLTEYGDFHVTVTDGKIVMNAKDDQDTKEPEPAQLLLENVINADGARYDSLECHFGDDKVFYPITAGLTCDAVTADKRGRIKGAYEGQNIVLLFDRVADSEVLEYVTVNKEKFYPEDGILEYTMPARAVTVECHVKKPEPTPDPKPTPTESQVQPTEEPSPEVTGEATPKPTAEAVIKDSKSGKSGRKDLNLIIIASGGIIIVLAGLGVFLSRRKIMKED